MNLLLLAQEDFLPDGTVRLRGRRADRAREALSLAAGGQIRVGRSDGPVGVAWAIDGPAGELRLQVAVGEEPPSRPGVDLVLAMPRPKALKRILSSSASIGVDRLFLVNASRVEKSYFESKVLEPDFSRKLLIDGLEQAQDTKLPKVFIRERFRPFVEDELEQLIAPESYRVLAHPSAPAYQLEATADARRAVLAIGPERGWVPFEIDLLTSRGFHPASFGARALRVEVFVPFMLGWVLACRPPDSLNAPRT